MKLWCDVDNWLLTLWALQRLHCQSSWGTSNMGGSTHSRWKTAGHVSQQSRSPTRWQMRQWSSYWKLPVKYPYLSYYVHDTALHQYFFNQKIHIPKSSVHKLILFFLIKEDYLNFLTKTIILRIGLVDFWYREML